MRYIYLRCNTKISEKNDDIFILRCKNTFNQGSMMNYYPFNNTSRNDVYYYVDSYEQIIFEDKVSAKAFKDFVHGASQKNIRSIKNVSKVIINSQENIDIDILLNKSCEDYLKFFIELYNGYDGFIFNIVKENCQIATAFYIKPEYIINA